MGVYGLLARTRGSRSVQLGPHGSTEGPDEPEQDDRQGGKRSVEVARAGRRGGRCERPFRDTRRAAPRPHMARAVSTARASIAAVSDPFATEMDHGGVAESPLGPVSLCRLDFLSHSETDLDSFVHSPDGTIIEEFKLP